jgi:hypothetical protein
VAAEVAAVTTLDLGMAVEAVVVVLGHQPHLLFQQVLQ